MAISLIGGAICGLVGCVPPAVLFEAALRNDPCATVAAGLVSIFASFVMLSAALLVAFVLDERGFATFGGALVVAFLSVWAIEAVRGWRAANALSGGDGGR